MVDNQPKSLRNPGESDEDLLKRLFAEKGIKLRTTEEIEAENERLFRGLTELELIKNSGRMKEWLSVPNEERENTHSQIISEELQKLGLSDISEYESPEE